MIASFQWVGSLFRVCKLFPLCSHQGSRACPLETKCGDKTYAQIVQHGYGQWMSYPGPIVFNPLLMEGQNLLSFAWFTMLAVYCAAFYSLQESSNIL